VSDAVLNAAATSAQERLSRALIEDKVVKEAKVHAAASKKVLGVVNTSAGRKVEKQSPKASHMGSASHPIAGDTARNGK